MALARVVAHNEQHAESRHGGRPICDTTHCQAFLGTVRVQPEEEKALRSAAAALEGVAALLPRRTGALA